MLSPDARNWKRPSKKVEQIESGAKLQALLDDAMLSQAEAADLIGVDHRTMRRYVLGQTGYPYCVWFAMLVLREQFSDGKPNPSVLRKLKREELGRELDRRRKEQLRYASTSRAYARAAEQLRAVYDEFIRRDEKRQDGTVKPAEMTQANASGERRS